MSRVRVTQPEPPAKPISKEILAEAIVKIGEAADALRKSGLNEDAIVTLLVRKTQVSRSDTEATLKGLRQLRAWYLR